MYIPTCLYRKNILKTFIVFFHSLSYGLLDLNCFSGRASVSGGGGRESGHRPQVTRNLIKQVYT